MELPPSGFKPFFLFGMGNRRKLLYQEGRLLDALTGEHVLSFNILSERILLSQYRVEIETTRGRLTIFEDEQGVWIAGRHRREMLTEGCVNLPRFAAYPHRPLLRQLLHEVLINIVDGKPLPNLWVYRKPWYRDAAMVMHVLVKTGNIHLIRNWIMGIREPFDRNNAGQEEPDNLGQVLYLVSTVAGVSHPVVQAVLDAVPKFRVDNYICGMTDFGEHPVYQTKWLKYGLRRLGLPDPYTIPTVEDSYSALFWMDFRREHVPTQPFGQDALRYPYLLWAEAHFHNAPPPYQPPTEQYPLTWEAEASQADYVQMAHVDTQLAEARVCVPHAWHAAEMFLYYLEKDRNGCRRAG